MSKPRNRRRVHWAVYLWPGLAHLWISGSLAGLALAAGFTFLLNLLVLSTVVWPEWLTPGVKAGCAVSAGVIWLAALVETRAELRRIGNRREREEQTPAELRQSGRQVADSRRPEALFSLAQHQYLRADWQSAERTLRSLLRLEKEDAEAHLLLAGVHRRMGRESDALRRLRRLLTRDEAVRWRFEINREIDLLTRAAEPAQNEETPREAA